MTDRLERFELVFHPATEKPEDPKNGETFLIYNPCDGYHIVEWLDDGFYSWMSPVSFNQEAIGCWAKLPAEWEDRMQAWRELMVGQHQPQADL